MPLKIVKRNPARTVAGRRKATAKTITPPKAYIIELVRVFKRHTGTSTNFMIDFMFWNGKAFSIKRQSAHRFKQTGEAQIQAKKIFGDKSMNQKFNQRQNIVLSAVRVVPA